MKEDKIRQKVLERDNYRCRYCGTTEKLEVHHIISKEEQELHSEAQFLVYGVETDDAADQGLSEVLNQPDYLITLCREHHELTFLSSAVGHRALYEDEESEELKEIEKKERIVRMS